MYIFNWILFYAVVENKFSEKYYFLHFHTTAANFYYNSLDKAKLETIDIE